MTDTVPCIDLTELEATAVREGQARASDEARRLGLDSRAHAEAVVRHLADVRLELGLQESTYQTDPERSGLAFRDDVPF
jgi:hypothetical protein